MAQREQYVDLSFASVNQLKDFRVHNVTTSQRTTLAASLGAANEGLHVWDTTEKLEYYWNGTAFVQGVKLIQGAMIYKGSISDTANAPAGADVGYVYKWSGGNATLTWSGQSFNPDAMVQAGDEIIYEGTNSWAIFQADLNPATETVGGYIALATASEVNTGTEAAKAVTPATLTSWKAAKGVVSGYFISVNITALTPLTITHNLNLSNKDAFHVRTADSTGSEIIFDCDSVDVNSLTLTSAVALTAVKVFVAGF